MVEGLRERKKHETRIALRDAAMQLVNEHGLDKVSVEAIARAAGVSTRTFFNYFPSKEDAIIGIAPSMPAPMLDYLRNRPAGEPPLDAVRAAVHATLESLQEDPDRWVQRRQLVDNHPGLAARYAARLAEMERDLVVEVAKRGGTDPDTDPYPGTVVGAALAATRVAMTVWQAQQQPTALADLLDEVFDHLASGLVS
jgi:AcrR family transcriptional regulator